MKSETHPTWYPSCKVYYNGEVVMTVGATVPELKVDVWSGSHPFFTGKTAFVDAAGRVEKFQKKFAGNYFQNVFCVEQGPESDTNESVAGFVA